MVSPSAISPMPARAASAAIAATCASLTSPSKGSPKATETVSERRGPPSAAWRSAIRAMVATCSATEAPWFRMPKPSEAQTTTLASSQPAATHRSQPRSFKTRPMRETLSRAGSAAMISSAPAICGTRRGLTKETASIRFTPQASSRLMKSTRSSTERMAASFCSPSRAPTSTISIAWLGVWLMFGLTDGLMERRDQVPAAGSRTCR
jgi:hypothetical protein